MTTPCLHLRARRSKKEGRFIVSTRNRLFNMVSHSHRTTREITNGGAATLVEELASFREPVSVDRTKSFVKALSDIARELEASDVLDRAVERNDKDTSSTRMGNEARQHTPRELEASADANGFTIESLHGIHPHLLNPALNNLLPSGVFNALSSALEPLEDEAISLTWSSVFIAVMRQK